MQPVWLAHLLMPGRSGRPAAAMPLQKLLAAVARVRAESAGFSCCRAWAEDGRVGSDTGVRRTGDH